MTEEKKNIETQNNADFMGDGMPAGRAQNIKGTLKRFFKDLMKQRGKIVFTFFCLAVSAVCTIITPALIGEAINQIFDGVQKAREVGGTFTVNLATMGGIMLAILILYLLGALFNYIPQYILASVSQNLTLSLRESISGKLNRLPLRYYDTHKKGDILSRVTSDLEKVADTLQEGLTEFISAVITIIGAFAMMLFISPSLTVIALLAIIVSMAAAVLISIKTNRFYAKNQSALGELNANIEESFTGNSLIKAFNLQAEMMKTNDELNENLRKASLNAQFITYAINPLIRLMGQIGYVVIAVRGAMSVISGSISIGEVQAIFQYINQISEPVTQMSYTLNNLQAAIASVERVYQIEDELEEMPDATDKEILPKPKGNVSFEQVRFGYSDERILMKDIDIQIKAGSKVAVVGPTGAGKTTLVNLLMRFYELQGGRITIDGVNIKDMSRRELRSILGMVLQDTWLFNGTIAENIAYGRGDAPMEEIIQAAKAARIDHFIRTLSQGYQTIIDDELAGISGGQKQLMTIARVILANPSILILDEATSSVDTRTEVEIQKAMDHLMKGRTSFIIAHRLSTIRDADLILVMREGTIIEQGTHKELLARNGFYAELYRSQFAAKAS
ncbi:ABC transporter ATP-binding protein/permease [[Clostridium] scindens]|uniref:ABC transporter ATP-binding protein n=1 Tax=Clostridium scindens (strain JCM 10418 / VPI 12708) TaxID=29347 RepID=UPI000409A95F|nr:ABC transporter ATP-binding protein [[Clostridium] scindens]MCB6285643.1 ABC transporter ATP-binding protein/permease [[Clostridium] scindens]MCB6420281.1 ABC transporter ATP-binding protein/permease [[Clostridium] scindens]MCB6643628.1 ABC transporter ATP-binding protein/permease [[Clostridium] scindens]MCB7192106.1 ABC transporter ATP-binding protein/permease [[Clostridium] scindens]MCB7285289.1 ABC transporter ATP-binding protein/permease [[Clostridium] scindens]